MKNTRKNEMFLKLKGYTRVSIRGNMGSIAMYDPIIGSAVLRYNVYMVVDDSIHVYDEGYPLSETVIGQIQ